MALWALAMPLFSSPDEPTHIMRAAAVDRGELLGAFVDGPGSPFSLVHLPEYYANVRSSPNCYHTRPTVPASCAPPVPVVCPATPIPHHPACDVGFIYDARYPPLYYWIVGLPSLLGVGNWVVYLMRLWSAVFCAGFVALAATAVLAWSRTRAPLIGIVAAATPLVLYLGGSVNPSSLEVAAALCAWTSGALLVTERATAPPGGLIATFIGSATTLVLIRGLSPLWLLGILVALVLIHRPGSLRTLSERRGLRIGAAIVVVASAIALVWVVKEHSLLVFSLTKVPRSVPFKTVLKTSFLRNRWYIPDLIGVFGAFDTWAPRTTYVGWYALVIVLVLVAARRARWIERFTLAAITLAIVIGPVLISSSQAYKVGYIWQGRDTLPFAVGLPIVAAALLAGRFSIRGPVVGALVAVVAGIAQFGAFYEALRRYAVGTAGSDFGFLTHADWHGPLPNLVVVIFEALVLIVGYGLFVRALRRAPSGRDGTDRAEMAPAAEIA